MGTILSNPYEMNFAQTARNAENIKEAETTSGLLSSETRTTNCNSTYPNTQVEIYEQTRVHPNPYNNSNLSVTCEGYYYPDNPGNGDRNCGTRYEVRGLNGNVKGTGSPLNIPTSDFQGDIFTKGYQQYYSSLVDARMVRDAEVAHWNVFRSEAGCKDSKALNYSSGASTRNCPCTSAEPVWEFNKSWSETPILQPVAETDGDCSCIYAPTYTEGGYIVEQWTYKGQPTNEYDTNPPYAKILHKWEWEEKAGKSDIPQPDKSDNKVRIAKSGYRATGLTTQEYIVKPSLMPTSWKKYRITTATGFQKFGCMDSTAQNYVEGAVAEDPDNPCEYCHDSDTHSEYDSDAGKCVCKAGYKRGILGTFGKCVKDKQTKTTPSPDPTPEKTFTATGLVAGIVGLTAVGIVVSTVISAKNQEN